jgi:ABC-type lipoprotein release transport system permease subunit
VSVPSRSLLYGISAQDPLALLAAVALLAAMALAAAWWPSHRAAMIDPMLALRQQ